MTGRDFVIDALRGRLVLQTMGAGEWSSLVRQARRADLLARLASTFESHGLAAQIPAPAAAHFEAASRLVQAQHAEVARELAQLRHALREIDAPVLLLKGAAYVRAGLPAAAGRTLSDIDILVPRARLHEVESALLLAGWATTHHSAYDQRYYREWMHELPPLLHIHRLTVLDVHHAIMPTTAAYRPPSEKLFAAAVGLAGDDGFAVLAPTDMVLHSMAHLLTNEDLSHGLRDLSDIDLLIRHFAAQRDFWPQLSERARELGLARIAHHGVRCVERVLGTPVPAEVHASLAADAPARPLRRLADAAWHRVLRSPHPSAADHWTPLAHAALFVRAHWLRMPPSMLLRHALVKALGLNKPPSNVA